MPRAMSASGDPGSSARAVSVSLIDRGKACLDDLDQQPCASQVGCSDAKNVTTFELPDNGHQRVSHPLLCASLHPSV